MAGRPRTPTNILRLKGSIKKDPLRHKDRENEPQNINPVGEPLYFLKDDEIEAWHLIVDRCIPGVLGEADSLAVAMAAKTLAVVIRDEANNQDKTLLKCYFSQFGMMPADRSKISVPKKKPENKFDD